MTVLDYVASVPERVVRATAAVGGGAIAETAKVLLPRVVRDGRLYQSTVERLLRIVVELVGGVEDVYAPDAMPVGELATRKTVGNVLEAGGVLAAGWSPLWVLAATADITGGTRAYLETLVRELKTSQLLPSDVEIGSFDDLLATLETTSGTLADTVDLPPLNVADMRTTWHTLREQAGELPSAAELATIWEQLQRVSRTEGQSVLAVSSAVTMSAVRAGIQLGDAHIWSFYRRTLGDITAQGWWNYLRRSAAPYVRGAGRHLDPRHTTFTQRWLRKQPA
jgi:hypothetical protein